MNKVKLIIFDLDGVLNSKIKTFDVEKMWGLGTPEDLKYYVENYKK
jgi:hypothetical protein